MNITFGEKLCDLRKERGLTFEQLREAIDNKLSVGSLKEYENDNKNPTLKNVKILATFYSVSLDWLAGLVEDKHGIVDDLKDTANKTYGLSAEALSELSATVNLADMLKKKKVVANDKADRIKALDTIIRYDYLFCTLGLMWDVLFAEATDLKIVEPPRPIPKEWKDGWYNDNGNGGERYLNESEVIHFRLMRLNEQLIKFREKLQQDTVLNEE